MMASQPNGPDKIEREDPGDTQTNPAGASSPKPAEGPDDEPPEGEGSPNG